MNKTTQLTMFSSKTGNWSTPVEFFNKLDWRFGPFDLDPLSAPISLQRQKMVFPKNGKDLLVLSIRHMDAALRPGSRKPMKKRAPKVPEL